jgi:hypothetical protein
MIASQKTWRNLDLAVTLSELPAVVSPTGFLSLMNRRAGDPCAPVVPQVIVLMKQPGLDGRHRTLLGRISHKHGNTLVETLRKQHGANFLPQFKPSDDDLKDVLHTLNEPSLSQLEKHHPG